MAKKQDDEQVLKDIVDESFTVYEKHSESERVSVRYLWILDYLASKQDDEQVLKDIVDESFIVYEKHSESESVSARYLWILDYLALKQDDEQELKDTADEVSTVYQKHSESEKVATAYLWILYNLAKKQDDEQVLKAIANKASTVYEKHSGSERVSGGYLWILSYLSSKQGNEKSLKNIADKASVVYQKHSELVEVATPYLSILSGLANKQDDKQVLKDIADKASTVYEKHSGTEGVSVRYLLILYYLSSKQGNEKFLKDTVNKAATVYKKNSDSEDIVHLYGRILVNHIRGNISISELNEDLKKLDSLLDNHFTVRLDLVIDMMSSLISYLNDQIISSGITEQEKLKEWIDKFQNKLHSIESIQNSNNGMLSDLLKKYKSDSIATEHILNVYNLVLKIKFELAVKEFPKDGFGHYTTARTLHIHLSQKENILNKSKYKITSRSRLYNVDYMNDPEEGKILDRYLLQQKEYNLSNVIEPSPWFLMCLTTAIDDLAMWSQYGANAEGVFLELKSDSFQLVSSTEDIDWLSGKSSFVRLDNKINETNSSSKQESEKDKLFRICYLDEKELKEGKLVISYEDVLLKEEERKTVTSLLRNLKEKVGEIYKLHNTQLFNDVDKLLEEIRYLFKASGYKYEKELRVLRYATIESTAIEANESKSKDPKVTELIGIQYDNDTLAKPYLEREDPIQIKRIIFGPKFSRPEYVTPLIRLVDKDIEFTISERKFK